MTERQQHLLHTVMLLVMAGQYKKVLIVVNAFSETTSIVNAMSRYTGNATFHWVKPRSTVHIEDAQFRFATQDTADRMRGSEWDLLVYFGEGLLCESQVHYSVRLGLNPLVLRPKI